MLCVACRLADLQCHSQFSSFWGSPFTAAPRRSGSSFWRLLPSRYVAPPIQALRCADCFCGRRCWRGRGAACGFLLSRESHWNVCRSRRAACVAGGASGRPAAVGYACRRSTSASASVVFRHARRIKTRCGWEPATGSILVSVAQPVEDLQAGRTVQLTGMLSRPKPAMNPGQFDWAAYYRSQRMLAEMHLLHASGARILGDNKGFRAISWLANVRAAARHRTESRVRGQPSS